MTEDEQTRLERISRMMRCDDPALERALATGRFRNRRLYLAGNSVAAAAVLVLSVALCLGDGVLILAAWILLTVGVLVRVLAD